VIFNRIYHARAGRGAMVSVGELLGELVERAADRRRRAQKRKGASAVQLELFPEPVITVERPPADQPLADLFPEAYS
jgi:hypothetical protein